MEGGRWIWETAAGAGLGEKVKSSGLLVGMLVERAAGATEAVGNAALGFGREIWTLELKPRALCLGERAVRSRFLPAVLTPAALGSLSPGRWC